VIRVLLASSVAVLLGPGCRGFDHRGGGGPGGNFQGNSFPAVTENALAGSACDSSAPFDPCAGAGLACTPTLADGGFTCQPPGEFFNCQPDAGCAAGLSCLAGFCLEACASTSDCFDPLTVCAPFLDAGSQCLLNECEQPGGVGLWQACPSSVPDGGDGLCVPLGLLDPRGPASGCQQAGGVAAGGACQLYRADGGPGFCGAGLMCMVEAAGANLGLCLPACNAFEPTGPACAAGTACVSSSLPLPPPAVSWADYDSLTGVCAQSCSLVDAGSSAGDAGVADTGSGCPAPTSCVNGSVTQTAVDVCLP
jgi:hypothetical protein